jgi:hypothetical protein
MFSLQPAVGPTTVANDSGRLILNFFTWHLFLENREKNPQQPAAPLRRWLAAVENSHRNTVGDSKVLS